MLIEHDRQYERTHAEALRELADPDVRYLHLTWDRWNASLAALLSACSFTPATRERVLRPLSPDEVAYSGGPNKCFLAAAALGVTVIHRRDTDQVADIRDGAKAFPGVLEVAAIGKAVTDLPGADSRPDRTSAARTAIKCVGSSVFGDAGHDRRDLLASGEDHVVALEMLSRPALTLSEARSAIHKKFVEEPALRHEDDYWDSDVPARVSVGVSCVKDIFRELPEMPIQDMLGSDYFQKSLLGALEYPIVFHSRKMRHDYEAARKRNSDLATVTGYALRDLRNVMFLPVRTGLCEEIRSRPDYFTDGEGRLRPDRLAAQLEATYQQHVPNIRDVPQRYGEIYAAAARGATADVAMRLRAVSAASTRARDAVIDDIRTGVADYSLLIRAWPELVANADTIGPQILGFIS